MITVYKMTEEKITIGMMLDPKDVDKKVNVNEIFKKTKKKGDKAYCS